MKLIGCDCLFSDDFSIKARKFIWATARQDVTPYTLGPKAMWREMAGANGSYELREPTDDYEAVFDTQNGDLRQKNTFFWDISI
ncbi:MAG: hypothetical protein FJ117_22860 [Deltaproteobacteria bacterium]|nr:hypothetical protein [Deltaproteobacteria bacterium]